MSSRGWACDSNFLRTMWGSRPKSTQVWSKENSPPVPSVTHL